MIKIYTLFLVSFLLTINSGIKAQNQVVEGSINYTGISSEQITPQQSYSIFAAENLDFDLKYFLPLVKHEVESDFPIAEINSEFMEATFAPCSEDENNFILESGFPAQPEITISHKSYTSRKQQFHYIEFIPIKYNPGTGSFEKLIEYKIAIENVPGLTRSPAPTRNYATESVLSNGTWYKFSVSESGVYKISYQELESLGINLSGINPNQIQLFSNAGYMLPEANDEFRHDDLSEIPIYVAGENDGSFDESDYILFYGLSPHKIQEVLGFMLHDMNLYDDHNYYFLTFGQAEGKRIESVPSSNATPTNFINKFNDYRIYEEDNINLIESGKTWYAEEFGENLNQSYNFSFPDLINEENVVVKFGVANRTFINDGVHISINEAVDDTLVLTSVSTSSTKFAQKKKKTYTFETSSDQINVNLSYVPAETSSRMWLDYIYVNAISELKLNEAQLQFRELSSIADDAVTQFTINNTNTETIVWDVTDYINPITIESSFSGGSTQFTVETDELREFLVFDGSGYFSPEFVEEVSNQNLHGYGPVDYVLLVHPMFMEQAERLKIIHETYNNFDVLITTPQEVYNEFSSGKQDPTAIRDLMKMFYDRYTDREPKYLLLFGDGSFDPKDRIEHNTNFIPTFQTEDSWITAQSYVIDDYFGLLDEDEGADAIGYLDIGIGRLPVQTPEEAEIVVDKIERYLQPSEQNFGDWRTKICIIADDEDGNLHLDQADSIASPYGSIPGTYNQHKIYLDAFNQQSSPSGDKYPDVVEALNKQVNEGALIVNYIGHGGTGGWAHERILQQNDILGWENVNHLPVFVTATCEFSRFDEPEIVSGGELVILNPNGGGIGLFTTTRLAYSQSNFRLNLRLFSRTFTPVDGEMPYLGDLIRESKPPGQLTTRNFVLLGDPGIRMAYPKYNISTLTINGNSANGQTPDTLKALQHVTITGEVTDLSDNMVSTFNGTIYPVLYDKTTVYKTIGNDNSSYPVEFTNQDKIVWKGKASVTNGQFSFSLVIPKDIALELGQAKISYYAFSENSDAFGYYNNFMLGSISEDAAADKTGPEIDLFINNTDFTSGDLTHENPVLLAYLQDENGINLSSNGIGHNITLVMNDNHSDVLNVTDYFEPTLDDYQKGQIEYPFYKLPDGNYTLTLKAWDNFNNSSENSIAFRINTGASLDLTNVMCSPNPFSDQTTFSFSHTKPGSDLNIVMEIYSLFGRYVLSSETTVNSPGTKVEFLNWNGRDVNGARIPKGVYIYTLTVTDEEGLVSQSQQKLVIR